MLAINTNWAGSARTPARHVDCGPWTADPHVSRTKIGGPRASDANRLPIGQEAQPGMLGLGLGGHGLGHDLEDFGLGLDLGLATLVLAS